MPNGCQPEIMDPRCSCTAGYCSRKGRRGTNGYTHYGDARCAGCNDIQAGCGCAFPGDDEPPEDFCVEAPLFEDIDDGKVAGWYGSTCKTERETEGNPPCKPACQFDDPRPEYCEEEDRLRAQVFEDLPDGKATGFVFPDCENRRMDPQACIEPCNPEWLEELEQAKEFLCPERKPFEDAPDGYLLRVETCKGASFFVTGWCQRSKSRRPGWTLCGGMHMYTKTCMRLNLCGGLKVSY